MEQSEDLDKAEKSKALLDRPSEMGDITTGSEHPDRKDISEPSSSVPSSSNLGEQANRRTSVDKKHGVLDLAQHTHKRENESNLTDLHLRSHLARPYLAMRTWYACLAGEFGNSLSGAHLTKRWKILMGGRNIDFVKEAGNEPFAYLPRVAPDLLDLREHNELCASGVDQVGP
ncbi:hypothetical protein FGRMN_4395 [Fusarium graminum]|nr:hypothetical protein FGRMN_4395 [Fusarium graminum]